MEVWFAWICLFEKVTLVPVWLMNETEVRTEVGKPIEMLLWPPLERQRRMTWRRAGAGREGYERHDVWIQTALAASRVGWEKMKPVVMKPNFKRAGGEFHLSRVKRAGGEFHLSRVNSLTTGFSDMFQTACLREKTSYAQRREQRLNSIRITLLLFVALSPAYPFDGATPLHYL